MPTWDVPTHLKLNMVQFVPNFFPCFLSQLMTIPFTEVVQTETTILFFFLQKIYSSVRNSFGIFHFFNFIFLSFIYFYLLEANYSTIL